MNINNTAIEKGEETEPEISFLTFWVTSWRTGLYLKLKKAKVQGINVPDWLSANFSS